MLIFWLLKLNKITAGRTDLFKRRPLEYHTFKYPADRCRRNQNFLRFKSNHEQLPIDNYYTLVAEDPKQRFDLMEPWESDTYGEHWDINT